MDNYYKYPRTPHLPWSPGISGDDISLEIVDNFIGKEVVVCEKLDGENTTMYPDHIHARSIDSKYHPSRDWIRKLHGEIAHLIPPEWRLCGENMYARHSIGYENLQSYFYLFSVWNEQNVALDWDETVEWAGLLELVVPPIFYRGPWDEALIRNLKVDTDQCEGYVVRTVAGFVYDHFQLHLAKWVRAGHVQTDQHWMHRQVIPNKLASSADKE